MLTAILLSWETMALCSFIVILGKEFKDKMNQNMKEQRRPLERQLPFRKYMEREIYLVERGPCINTDVQMFSGTPEYSRSMILTIAFPEPFFLTKQRRKR